MAGTADKRSSVERLADQEVENLKIVDLNTGTMKSAGEAPSVAEILRDDVVVELARLETRKIRCRKMTSGCS